MFTGINKNKDELLRQAFLKIKQENNDLNEKMSAIEKRLLFIEQQRYIDVKKADTGKNIQEITKIETAKASLSPTEKEILYLSTMSKDKKYTYGEIASLLGKSNNTVKAQIQSIIKKGIQLSFIQMENNQRAYYLDNRMFELIIKTKN
jgi:DNA-binding CsgD family transcriptional regulator